MQRRFGHFLCVLAVSSVICRRIHLFNVSILWVSKVPIKKSLREKFIQVKMWQQQLFLFATDTPL